ncbi:hypothetical protein [Jannaschia sp. LMIT008]|uniref:hypothetical protein n=1 Tax=Jannaschia maritima TaxID=3032585 RepID=UPI0028120476|nr:hypothetical protein [Jannaschia sp. LMIT008]
MIRNIEGNKLHRTLQNCIGNICECLSRAIDKLLNEHAPHKSGEKGLKQHWAEQVGSGAEAPGTPTWNKHQGTIEKQQDNLRDHLHEHEARGCGGPPNGGSPVPSDGWRWATRGLPTRDDWRANNSRSYEGLTGSPAGDAAAVVGGVGLGYLGYRAVRMLPSLLFPPSFVPNLLVP